MRRRSLILLTLLLVVAGAPIAPTPAGARAPERCLVFVTTDGLRWQEVFGGADEALLDREAGGVADVEALRREFWRPTPAERRAALMPFTWSVIARRGQLFGNRTLGSEVRVTNTLNFSYPGYNEMFTGAPDPRIQSNDKVPNPNVTVLEWLHRKPEFRGRIAAFCTWDVFPSILNSERSGIPVNVGWTPVTTGRITPELATLNRLMLDRDPTKGRERPDWLTFAMALEYLRAQRPRLLYVGLDGTDTHAHNGRYDHYLRTARQDDEYLKILWETIESIPAYRGRTTLLVTTDHGRGDGPAGWRHHGARVAGSEFIWVSALGPGIRPLGERRATPPITQSQIAATIAALVGEDYVRAVPRAAPPIADLVPSR